MILLATPLSAQGAGRTCQLEVRNVARQGVTVTITPTASNYFAGGDVRLGCRGQNVRIWTDSVASYQGNVVQFIGHFRYQDDEALVTSDFGTYYKTDERWEARGNVVYQNRRDSSELRGPAVNYYRKIRGVRELEEIYADQRPTLRITARDTADRSNEPYIVVADRIRTRGPDLMWAGGTVTIDRSDLRGRGDSLELDTGKGSAGLLLGRSASIRRTAQDSFALAGRRIILGLKEKELEAVTGRDSASLRSGDLDLVAEQIRLRLEARKVIQTIAWGKEPRPLALAQEYQVLGDSLAVDTPDEALRELRAFGAAKVSFRADTAQGTPDYVAGERIIASFGQDSSRGAPKTVLQTLEALERASLLYRIAGERKPGDTTVAKPSINYSRADRIRLTMEAGDSVRLRRVDLSGNVDGIQLSTDQLRLDTTRVTPRRP